MAAKTEKEGVYTFLFIVFLASFARRLLPHPRCTRSIGTGGEPAAPAIAGLPVGRSLLITNSPGMGLLAAHADPSG